MCKVNTPLIASLCLMLLASISLAQNPADYLTKVSSFGPLPYQSNIQVIAGYAFVMTTEGLNVIDVTIPTSPTLSAVYDDVNGGISKLVSQGTYLYILGSDLLYVCDISIPTAISSDLVLNL